MDHHARLLPSSLSKTAWVQSRKNVTVELLLMTKKSGQTNDLSHSIIREKVAYFVRANLISNEVRRYDRLRFFDVHQRVDISLTREVWEFGSICRACSAAFSVIRANPNLLQAEVSLYGPHKIKEGYRDHTDRRVYNAIHDIIIKPHLAEFLKTPQRPPRRLIENCETRC